MSNASVFLATASVHTDAAGALGGDGSIGDPLTVMVDGTTIDVNGSNELEVVAGAALTTPNIGAATGTSLVLSGDMKAATYHAGATAGATAGPFTVITGIQVTAGLVTTLTGS